MEERPVDLFRRTFESPGGTFGTNPSEGLDFRVTSMLGF